MTHLSVVIPVFKSEACLNELYNRLVKTLEKITVTFEILFIEDCGGDRSWEIILSLATYDKRVKGFQFSRNFGQHYGITAGLDYAQGDWVVVMDCDLQDRPEEILRLYKKAQEGFDVVSAKRKKRNDPFIKKINSWLFYKIFNYFLDIKYDGQVGNFRIISKKVVENCRLFREQIRFFGGIVNWMGFPTTSIEVQHDERFSGKSAYTFKKLWKLAIDLLIAYSDKPLRLAIRLGFFMSFLSFLYGSYIFVNAFFHHSSVLGWSSLIVSIYFTGGIIIAILGIIGVYLGKTFEETKKRPLYILANTINNEA